MFLNAQSKSVFKRFTANLHFDVLWSSTLKIEQKQSKQKGSVQHSGPIQQILNRFEKALFRQFFMLKFCTSKQRPEQTKVDFRVFKSDYVRCHSTLSVSGEHKVLFCSCTNNLVTSTDNDWIFISVDTAPLSCRYLGSKKKKHIRQYIYVKHLCDAVRSRLCEDTFAVASRCIPHIVLTCWKPCWVLQVCWEPQHLWGTEGQSLVMLWQT